MSESTDDDWGETLQCWGGPLHGTDIEVFRGSKDLIVAGHETAGRYVRVTSIGPNMERSPALQWREPDN